MNVWSIHKLVNALCLYQVLFDLGTSQFAGFPLLIGEDRKKSFNLINQIDESLKQREFLFAVGSFNHQNLSYIDLWFQQRLGQVVTK